MKAKVGVLALALAVVSCGSSGKPVVNDPNTPNHTPEHPTTAGGNTDRIEQQSGAKQPSCAGMQGNECQGKSCCSSLLVPGGKFLMGRGGATDRCRSELNCDGNDQPEHEVTVSEFFLDEFEVTVGRFRRFVDKYDLPETKPKAGAGAHPKIPDTGWQRQWGKELPRTADELKKKLECKGHYPTWRDTAQDTEQHPISCVNWYVAFAFCAWDGGRLPTEAEWEKAAAGGDENRLFPWGQELPDNTRAAYGSLYDGNNERTFEDIAPVGSFPAGQGRWGHKDLAGNMSEWVFDGYYLHWYTGRGKTCVDCANTETHSTRVQRGGAFDDEASSLRATYRFGIGPWSNYFSIGFRCARVRG